VLSFDAQLTLTAAIDKLPPDRIVRFGLARKFRTASVFEALTVAVPARGAE
jgi:ABC-type uncharacterized transport system ATPase subunit